MTKLKSIIESIERKTNKIKNFSDYRKKLKGIELDFAYSVVNENSGKWMENDNLMTLALMIHPTIILQASESAKGNKEYAKIVVQQTVFELSLFSKEVKADIDVAMVAINKDSRAIFLVDEILKNKKELLLYALENSSKKSILNLTRINQDEHLSKLVDEDVLLACIKNVSKDYESIPESYKKNKDFVMKAINTNPSVYNLLKSDLSGDIDVRLLAIEKGIKYILEDLKDVEWQDTSLITKLLEKTIEINENTYLNNSLMRKLLLNSDYRNVYKKIYGTKIYNSEAYDDNKLLVIPNLLKAIEGLKIKEIVDVNFVIGKNKRIKF